MIDVKVLYLCVIRIKLTFLHFIYVLVFSTSANLKKRGLKIWVGILGRIENFHPYSKLGVSFGVYARVDVESKSVQEA